MATPSGNSVTPSGITLIDGLIQGSSWSLGGSRVLTYKLHEVPGFEINGIWNKPTAVHKAMKAWSNVANINFTNLGKGGDFNSSPADLAVTASGDNLLFLFNPSFVTGLAVFPDLNFGNNFLAALSLSFGFPVDRFNYPNPEGDIFIDSTIDHFFPGSFNRGGISFQMILHEIGHALGLKHPHDDGANSKPTFDDLGIGALDFDVYTLMSYNDWTGDAFSIKGNIATPMPLDILAIQYIYGANMDYHKADNVYLLKNDGIVRTIWDAGGIDTLDASRLPFGIDMSLEEAAYIQTGNKSLTAIAFNVTIENAIGTRFSDIITGNDADNLLKGGGGQDILAGGEGDDTIKGAKGKDLISGDNGADDVRGGKGGDNISGFGDDDYLNGGKGRDLMDGGSGNDTLEGGAGNDTLTGGTGSDDFIYSNNRTVGDLITDFDHAEGDQIFLNGGKGPKKFQWGYQSSNVSRANTTGSITSNFFVSATTREALIDIISVRAGSLFGDSIARGLSSIAYFFGLTSVNGELYYVIANQHVETASVTTTFSTISVAILNGITGLGTGTNQIAQSDIILF